MSKRSLEVVIGGLIFVALALKAPDILVGGLGCAWWTLHRSGGEARVQDVARAAMLGGVIARGLIFLAVFALLPLTTHGLGWLQFLQIGAVSTMTAFVILALGTLSLVEAFLLGVSVRLLGPWLPR